MYSYDTAAVAENDLFEDVSRAWFKKVIYFHDFTELNFEFLNHIHVETKTLALRIGVRPRELLYVIIYCSRDSFQARDDRLISA